MDHQDIEIGSPEGMTVAQWQHDNPAWTVMSVHPVLSTGPSGHAVTEFEVRIKHRGTGKILSASGQDPATTLARISEQF